MVCKTTVPLLLGLCRALGRYNGPNDNLISQLFPLKARPKRQNRNNVDVRNKSFSNFRSIIPRTLSMTFNHSEDLLDTGSLDSIVDLR
jgi:phosphatidylinositol 4-kinase